MNNSYPLGLPLVTVYGSIGANQGGCAFIFMRCGGTDKLSGRNCKNQQMNTYKRYRFPPDIISYAVWLYYRFNLSHRDVEDLLAERGITVSYESIRLWCIKFGAIYSRRLKRKH